STVPVPLDVAPTVHTIGAALGVAVVTGLLFGLIPAMHATRGDLAAALKTSSVGGDRQRSRLQRTFVVAQLSLSLVLLVMAGMFLSALYRSSKRDVGFEATTHVLAASFDLGLQGYTREQAAPFVDEVDRRVRALPGVIDVAFTNSVPMGERRIGDDLVFDSRESGAAAGPAAFSSVYENTIRPGF